mgnify:CR=1 FL=1
MRRPALRHTFLAISFLMTTALFAQTPSGPITIESTGAADKSYVELEGIWADSPGKGGAEGLMAPGTRKLIPVDGKMNGLAVFRPTIPAAGFYEIQVSYPAYANARGVKFAIEGVTRTMFPLTDFIPAGSPGSKADQWITVNDNLLLPEGYGVDMNRDGFEEVGAALVAHFPPRDAPAAVREAWFQTTASMEDGDVLTYSLMMHGAVHGLRIDGQNVPTAYKADDIDSYRRLVSDFLSALEAHRGQISSAQYERDKDFFTRLSGFLQA